MRSNPDPAVEQRSPGETGDAGVPILLADPKAGYVAHAAEIQAAIQRVLDSGQYILGPEVAAFEREYAGYHGTGFAVGVANGTDALELALRSVGVTRGDRVATVANTVSATVAAIEQIGARPVFVEIDAHSMLISPEALSLVLRAHEGGIKAVVPVHLYGHPADMPRIMEVASHHGAKVVEDCAQSHGAEVGGRKTGTWGHSAAYSFYPTKNLGCLGDGGAVYSVDRAVADRASLLRQYGWERRYVSSVAGRNSRLDELQAAILRVKLAHLDAENAIRRELAARYLRNLAGIGMVELPSIPDSAVPVWHQFTIRSPRRDELAAHLKAKGIFAGVLYPVPVFEQPAYKDAGLSLPVTQAACSQVLCLPVHPGLTTADIDRICTEIIRWVRL